MNHESLAAVDLGSNTFHLQVGRVSNGQIYLLDGLREPVRLGAGLTREGRIDRAARLRAIEALGRFGERLRDFSRDAVRAVGTHALRIAKNAGRFLEEAEATLGFPIEVIYGREEARLIYLGVAHTLPPTFDRRFVVDVGGGSTECIIGSGLEPELIESLSMGCLSYSLAFFPRGRINQNCFKRAELAAGSEMQRIVKAFRGTGWKQAVASSGTSKSIAAVLHESGWSECGITASGLERLRAQMVKAGEIAGLKLSGLREDRAQVLPGGVAILSALLDQFAIERLDIADGALRHGVLHDLLGRVTHRDTREATVDELMRRYRVDANQAERVARLAIGIHSQLAGQRGETDAPILRWAAKLHEIGISIAHAGYHKHSAYILSQADMPGFSKMEQSRLASIVLAHRGKLSRFKRLPAGSEDWNMILALRIAALFSLSRCDISPPLTARKIANGIFQLSLRGRWLDEHPLSAAALEDEAGKWRSLGMKIDLLTAATEKPRAKAKPAAAVEAQIA